MAERAGARDELPRRADGSVVWDLVDDYEEAVLGAWERHRALTPSVPVDRDQARLAVAAIFETLSQDVNAKADELHRRAGYGDEHLMFHSCPCWHEAVVRVMAHLLERDPPASTDGPVVTTSVGAKGTPAHPDTTAETEGPTRP